MRDFDNIKKYKYKLIKFNNFETQYLISYN